MNEPNLFGQPGTVPLAFVNNLGSTLFSRLRLCSPSLSLLIGRSMVSGSPLSFVEKVAVLDKRCSTGEDRSASRFDTVPSIPIF